MLRAIAICNTIVPGKQQFGGVERTVYDGDSPDEIALLECIRQNGVLLKERTRTGVVLEMEAKLVDPSNAGSTNGGGVVHEQWTVLNTLEFNSDRKRMSVIVKSGTAKVR